MRDSDGGDGVKGRVSLVGAGPGDPGLLTLKGRDRLKSADLVIYDILANPEHLKHVKNTSRTICVGKRFRHHPYSQRKINRLIIQAARKGQNVVRLKGGDPYLFGRGGEEALYLYDHGIAFEVIPGVTSATACGAYAGIPLTHREHNASVTFLTGHRAHDENLDSVPWERIASLNGTLVIYMGFYNLAKIAARLIRAGMPAQSRICVIEWGTLPKQRSCEGTLLNIAKKVKEDKLRAPALIIIGDVVSLKKRLDWYEKLPLFGKKIVVTRTREKIGGLAEKLKDLGAAVLEFPTIEIAPIRSFAKMDAAIATISNFDWLVFTSTYGVEVFFKRLRDVHKKDARALKGVCVICVGSETRKALEDQGLSADLVPRRFETAAIARELERKKIPVFGKKFLLVRAAIAPPELESALERMGAEVTRIAGYLTRIPRKRPKEAMAALRSGSADFVTFTSSSTVNHFVKILGLKNVKKIAKKTGFASIGPVTSKALKKQGLAPCCEATRFTVEGLVASLLRGIRKRKIR